MSDARLDVVIEVLESLIAWIAQSAGSPISHREAEMLLRKLRDEAGRE